MHFTGPAVLHWSCKIGDYQNSRSEYVTMLLSDSDASGHNLDVSRFKNGSGSGAVENSVLLNPGRANFLLLSIA